MPLLLGVILAISFKQFVGLKWNAVALGFSCVYLTWSVVAQGVVERKVRAQLASTGQGSAKFLVTSAPLNTILWRVIVMGEQSYSEGFYSFLDKPGQITFDQFEHQLALINDLKGNWAAERMAWFTHGFYSLREVKGQAILSDLRMGQEPGYVFQFALARREGSAWKEIASIARGSRGDATKALP